MREVKQKIYDYEDMEALKNMSCEEASDVLRNAYRGYINSYIFPNEYDEFSEDDYCKYAIQCAFDVAYRALNAMGGDAK